HEGVKVRKHVYIETTISGPFLGEPSTLSGQKMKVGFDQIIRLQRRWIADLQIHWNVGKPRRSIARKCIIRIIEDYDFQYATRPSFGDRYTDIYCTPVDGHVR